jgi:surfeit locus 1 family protein
LKITTRGVAAALLALLVAGVCIRLGFWQLQRLEQRRVRNAELRQALSQPPLQLRGEVLARVLRDPQRFLFRRVELRGVYDPAGEVVLRGQALEGRPGVRLAAPLRVGGGDTAVVVDRGWVAAPDAVTVDPGPFAEPGPRVVRGVLLPAPAGVEEAGRLISELGGVRSVTYRRLPLAELRTRVGYAVAPVYVQQLPGDDAATPAPRRVPLPALDEGPHLGYAVQWFSFAAIALLGFALVVWRRSRDPR